MLIEVRKRMVVVGLVSFILVLYAALLHSQTAEGKPLILQEMTWTDVQEYLKRSDMVIIPLGSTEQHGPHLPLGSDWYEAMATVRRISAQTGVLVAPVVMAGYSVYHSGFPGTMSLKPETMEHVLYETAEMLVKYGFRRIMFFNNHGGNSIVEASVIHRVNHDLQASAVAIGEGSSIQKGGENLSGTWFDEHAGVEETSMLLLLQPELVRMERAEKPRLTFSSRLQELFLLVRQFPQLAAVISTLLAVPEETRKGGSSREISSNGIWSSGDPRSAKKEIGEKIVNRLVENAVDFIQAWNQVKTWHSSN